VESVKKVLEAHPAIVKTEISLNSKGPTMITMKETLSVDELQKQLDTIKGYTIKEIEKQS
jgi:copper chaperone